MFTADPEKLEGAMADADSVATITAPDENWWIEFKALTNRCYSDAFGGCVEDLVAKFPENQDDQWTAIAAYNIITSEGKTNFLTTPQIFFY